MSIDRRELKRQIKKRAQLLNSAVSRSETLFDRAFDDVVTMINQLPDGWESYYLPAIQQQVLQRMRELSLSVIDLSNELIPAAIEQGQSFVVAPLLIGGLISARITADKERALIESRAATISRTLSSQIIDAITNNAMGFTTAGQAIESIRQNIDSGGKVRSAGILQHELKKIHARQVQKSMLDNADRFDKMWLHAGSPTEPRESHLDADGQAVPVDQAFDIGGAEMMHPLDANAPIEEVIHCGCVAVLVLKNKT